jgi:hypothetical protein
MVKEKVFEAVLNGNAHTRGELINHIRPSVFSGLSDEQKHLFIRMPRREQDIYIEAVIKGMDIAGMAGEE